MANRFRSVVAMALALSSAQLASAELTWRDAINTRQSISADGRFVVFEAEAGNLDPVYRTRLFDVLLWDRHTRSVQVISGGMGNVAADGHSGAAVISDDGNVISFASGSTNLVADDSNGRVDVFVWTRGDRSIRRISVTSAGLNASGGSTAPAISADGRYVAFVSQAPLDVSDTNGADDVYLHDLQTNTTTRISLGSAGEQGLGPGVGTLYGGAVAISPDGRYVAMVSHLAGLVPGITSRIDRVYLKDTLTGSLEHVSVGMNGGPNSGKPSARPSLSSDGRYVAFWSEATDLVAGDTNGVRDIFVRDMHEGVTTRVSITDRGEQATAFNLSGAISHDGARVVFSSDAQLLAGVPSSQRNVYLRELRSGIISLVSRNAAGRTGNSVSYSAGFAANGRHVVFSSWASDLVGNDPNQNRDVFTRDLINQSTMRVAPVADVVFHAGFE